MQVQNHHSKLAGRLNFKKKMAVFAIPATSPTLASVLLRKNKLWID
jgi:hypothetical protein